MNVRRLRISLKFLFVVVAALAMFSAGQGQPEEGEPGVLRNPLNAYAGSDPWLTYFDGNYYLSATTWSSDLLMRKSPTLAGLKTAVPVRIYHETDPSRCCNMWAPEFYLLDGPNGPRWYFYYTSGTSGTLDNQRTHVLESAGTDPMGPYTYKARVFDPANDVWAIDGSVMTLDDQLYFLFSSWVGPLQSLFIAPMSDPWTISGPRVLMSQPEFDWELMGGNVNEGPVGLHHGEDTFVVYSANPCSGPNYQLGMLKLTGDDPLRRDSWEKHPEPLFVRSDENGVYGPGHNGFFKSPDGTEDWIVYHANETPEAGCDDRRTTRVQRITWNDDGTPNFGMPVATTEQIAAPSGDMGIDPAPEFDNLVTTSFKSYAYDSAYLRRVDTVARVDVMPEIIADAEFYLVPGLADPDAVSIMSVTLAGYFLRHDGNVVVFGANDGSPEFAGDATWRIVPGLADATWISFESYNQPGRYLGKMFGVSALFEVTDLTTDVAREDATFLEIRD